MTWPSSSAAESGDTWGACQPGAKRGGDCDWVLPGTGQHKPYICGTMDAEELHEAVVDWIAELIENHDCFELSEAIESCATYGPTYGHLISVLDRIWEAIYQHVFFTAPKLLGPAMRAVIDEHVDWKRVAVDASDRRAERGYDEDSYEHKTLKRTARALEQLLRQQGILATIRVPIDDDDDDEGGENDESQDAEAAAVGDGDADEALVSISAM